MTPAGCAKDFPRGDRCSAAPGLGHVTAVALSPDGVDVYAAAPANGSMSGAITVFARDAGTGALSETDCLLSGAPAPGPCRDAGGIAGASDVVVSPDSRDVYFAAWAGDAVTSFRMQPGGTLLQTGCIQQVPEGRDDGFTPDKRCRPGVAIWDPEVVTISRDGATVFAGGNDTVTAYRRDPQSGILTQIGCAEEGRTSKQCLQTRATFALNGIATTGDGRNLYVTSAEEGAVTVPGTSSSAARRAAGRLRPRIAHVGKPQSARHRARMACPPTARTVLACRS